MYIQGNTIQEINLNSFNLQIGEAVAQKNSQISSSVLKISVPCDDLWHRSCKMTQ